ncbi:MAG: hypothetical protein ACTSQE_01920 [Candidatus Heimdallarchaeaceae archaeon]
MKRDMPQNLDLCVVCKTSRYLCGKSPCPLLQKWFKTLKVETPKIRKIDESFAPPSFFVGSYNYPQLNAGPLLTLDRQPSSVIDNSDTWNERTQEEIIRMRLAMFRAKAQIDAKKPLESPIIEKSQEMLLGIKPVTVEVELERSVIPKITLDTRLAPHGPVAPIKRLSVNENQTPLRPIEKVYYDDDLKATEAIFTLGQENISVSSIVRVMSAGMLGVAKNRKLVPTRWSITAVDDALSKQKIEQIKKYQPLGEFRVFSSYFFGNKFLIILIPDVWSFEVIELWIKGAYMNPSNKDIGVSDYEFYKGRKTYASKVAGGYYATRIAITEYLEKIQRQAQVIAIREIDENYKLPLGVWVVRQAARQAMSNPYITADSLDGAFDLIPEFLRYPIKYYKHKSKIYKFRKSQTRLDDFLVEK